MKSVKLIKKETGKEESNFTHTTNERIIKEENPKIRTIEGYDLKWNVNKDDK